MKQKQVAWLITWWIRISPWDLGRERLSLNYPSWLTIPYSSRVTISPISHKAEKESSNSRVAVMLAYGHYEDRYSIRGCPSLWPKLRGSLCRLLLARSFSIPCDLLPLSLMFCLRRIFFQGQNWQLGSHFNIGRTSSKTSDDFAGPWANLFLQALSDASELKPLKLDTDCKLEDLRRQKEERNYREFCWRELNLRFLSYMSRSVPPYHITSLKH